MIDLVIEQRRKDLGGFEVGRVLPFHAHRMVGPFIFFDHMGPTPSPPPPPSTNKPSAIRTSPALLLRS